MDWILHRSELPSCNPVYSSPYNENFQFILLYRGKYYFLHYMTAVVIFKIKNFYYKHCIQKYVWTWGPSSHVHVVSSFITETFKLITYHNFETKWKLRCNIYPVFHKKQRLEKFWFLILFLSYNINHLTTPKIYSQLGIWEMYIK